MDYFKAWIVLACLLMAFSVGLLLGCMRYVQVVKERQEHLNIDLDQLQERMRWIDHYVD